MIPVHPRGCGEHSCPLIMLVIDRRFIPAGAGNTCAMATAPYSLIRFIPAGAGNTITPDQPPRRRPVHPRGCGEHSMLSTHARRQCFGSSPRVRGTQWLSSNAVVTLPVHPRGCGEHSTWIRSIRCIMIGSSPRVRGTPSTPLSVTASDRFIPAGAGNTTRHSSFRHSTPVHPRGCGEHGFDQANKTARIPVHPRGCGEHSPVPGAQCRDLGSSPRVRGTPAYRMRDSSLDRFIPAGAGNTH